MTQNPEPAKIFNGSEAQIQMVGICSGKELSPVAAHAHLCLCSLFADYCQDFFGLWTQVHVLRHC